MESERQSDGVADWGSFPDTVLHFRTSPPVVIDLRGDINASTRSGLRELLFGRPFGIITAQDPMGVTQSRDVNLVLAASLQKDVAELGVQCVHIDACSPDGSHCESSIAIAQDLQSLVVLAYRYDQLALFWFDGESFWIVPVHSRNARLRLPAHV